MATFVAVQNLTGVAANISLTYHSVTGTVKVAGSVVPGSATSVYASDDYVPDEFVGGVVVEADRNVAAVALLSRQLVLDREIFLPIALR